MKRIIAGLLAAVALAVALPAPAAQAAVDRVCVTSSSAAASQVFAYYSFGTSILRPGQCSSSSVEPYKFKIGGIACRSPWGALYAPYSEHGFSLISGVLYLTCR